jgi:hypothetical protein
MIGTALQDDWHGSSPSKNQSKLTKVEENRPKIEKSRPVKQGLSSDLLKKGPRDTPPKTTPSDKTGRLESENNSSPETVPMSR